MSSFYLVSSSSKSKIYAPKIINGEYYFSNCDKCGSTYLKNDIENIDLEIEGKGKYPDALLCGNWPILIVSEKVLKKWKEYNISGFRNYSVRLFKKNGEEIPEEEAVYHHIIITGRSELDLDRMGVKVNKCNTCGTDIYNKQTWEFGRPIIKKNSWDGTDIFVFEQFKYSALCGIKFLELIHNNNFTNFSFSKIEDMFDYTADEIDIKKLFKIER